MFWTVHNIQEMYSQSVYKISMSIYPKLPGLKEHIIEFGMEQPWTFLMQSVSVHCLDGGTSVVLKYRLKNPWIWWF